MNKMLVVHFRARVSTRGYDQVALSGDIEELGSWNPMKMKFMDLIKSDDGNLWSLQLAVANTTTYVRYRYIVCRRFNVGHSDDLEETFIIRHWEAGVESRVKHLNEFDEQLVDTYGEFDEHLQGKMILDQGWLLDESEIQIRFYNDPIKVFKKKMCSDSYNVKCSAVSLLQMTPHNPEIEPEIEDIVTDSAPSQLNSPLIRVTKFGEYLSNEQSDDGMNMKPTDYVVFKLRSFDLGSYGIKMDFYKPKTNAPPKFIGFSNLLPVHLSHIPSRMTLAISGLHGFPVGQVTVRYMAIKPCKINPTSLCNFSQSYTRYWNSKRRALDIGHRGIGDTHSRNITSSTDDASSDPTHENTIQGLQQAGEHGADFVEMDVQLSSDGVPVIWHDFRVSILLRMKQKGQHRVHHVPVSELTYSQLQELRVEYAKLEEVEEQQEDGSQPNSWASDPFPSLEDALGTVDTDVGFFIEIKYPQIMFDLTNEENIDSCKERNEYVDNILKVVLQNSGSRRITLASFDPDICIMCRLKQNKYPVMFLLWDRGETVQPYWHDIRTHRVDTAIALAKSEKFLGLGINTSCVLGLRREENLLNKIHEANLIVFVWGPENNDPKVRDELKDKVQAICYDEIQQKQEANIFRMEHVERLKQTMSNNLILRSLITTPNTTPSTEESMAPADPNTTRSTEECIAPADDAERNAVFAEARSHAATSQYTLEINNKKMSFQSQGRAQHREERTYSDTHIAPKSSRTASGNKIKSVRSIDLEEFY